MSPRHLFAVTVLGAAVALAAVAVPDEPVWFAPVPLIKLLSHLLP